MADDHHLMTKLFLGLLQASRAIKNPVQQTGFFAGYTGSKNPVRNKLKIQFIEFDFSKLIFQKSSTDQQGVTVIKFKNSRMQLIVSLIRPKHEREEKII
jgi:hypothetical protein